MAVAAAHTQRLHVLVTNETSAGFALLANVLAQLGHEVTEGEPRAPDVSGDAPDVALVGLGLGSEQALETISKPVRSSSFPVIVVVPETDVAYARRRGAARSVCLCRE